MNPINDRTLAENAAAAIRRAAITIGGQRLHAAATAATLWEDSLSLSHRGGLVPVHTWSRAYDLLNHALQGKKWQGYGVRDTKDELGDILYRMAN